MSRVATQQRSVMFEESWGMTKEKPVRRELLPVETTVGCEDLVVDNTEQRGTETTVVGRQQSSNVSTEMGMVYRLSDGKTFSLREEIGGEGRDEFKGGVRENVPVVMVGRELVAV
jgi:hypothetical protein